MPHLYFFSIFFLAWITFSFAYVASVNYYDKCRAPIFLSDHTWPIGLQVKKKQQALVTSDSDAGEEDGCRVCLGPEAVQTMQVAAAFWLSASVP